MKTLVIPTPVNFLGALAAQMQRQLRAGKQINIVVPNLRSRARMMVRVQGLVPVSIENALTSTNVR